MSKPNYSNQHGMRHTRPKQPTKEARTPAVTLPRLPDTEQEALHGLSAALAKCCDTAWEYASRAEYEAFKPWQEATHKEREYINGRLRTLTDGR